MAALACAAVLALPVLPASAGAKPKGTWIVKGAGYGHGIGMSQYGAYGSAKAGKNHQQILAQYYSGTTLGTSPSKTLRVLLLPYQTTVRFSGANAACGQALNPDKDYVAARSGNDVALRDSGGNGVANCGAVLSATGAGGTVSLAGKGTYRGALEVRASSNPGTLNAINAVDIESYLRGVVAKESPSSWPLEALKAQAVAARSYALTTGVGGNGFDAYDDTRSQVYAGVAGETPRTDLAVAATANQVVLYQGKVAETYFFSTSGGHTENNENSFLGGTPMPYLRGVPDPNEATAGSSYHRWVRKFSRRSIQAELGSLVKGRLKAVRIVKRGVSPRIVKARVIGTGGTTTTTGPELRARLGLPDTWATFKSPKQMKRKKARRARALVGRVSGW
jgi:stage II sporulation protein D